MVESVDFTYAAHGGDEFRCSIPPLFLRVEWRSLRSMEVSYPCNHIFSVAFEFGSTGAEGEADHIAAATGQKQQ